MSQDISQKRLAEKELEKNKQELEIIVKKRTKELEYALEAKSRFLAIMSHGKKFLEFSLF